ncbi:LysE family translocator [Roseibium algae]|uniref:LysE family transporter n=1 Tax=Roseibium algae TaxID=3123038 RepID=A0ABU8TGZ0_9HYPH
MSVLGFIAVGIAIGLITSAPVGPVNIMMIRHAIQRGMREGIIVGLGAVCADTIFAAVAVFGVSAVTQFIEGQVDMIKLVGGGLLIVFGLKVMTSHPHLEKDGADGAASVWADATAAFFLTLTNPGAVLGFIAIIGGLGGWRPTPEDHIGALALVAGVALGAASWWTFISGLVNRYSGHIDDHWLGRANRIAGTILVLFGICVFADLALTVL